MKSNWFVYILRCRDKTFYTGITNDIKRRLEEHNSSDKGAKYTRARRPVKKVFQKKCKDRADATKLEMQIKKMSRQQKKELISKNKK